MTRCLNEPTRSHPRAPADGSPYVYTVLTPRFAISTTDELLGQLRHLADSDHSLAIQTHISENPAEVKETKKLFHHLSTPEKPITYAGVYDHYHLLRDNTILAHAVHLEEEELKLIKEKNSGISHCPTSNFNLTSGMAKVGDMLDRGIKVSFPSLSQLPLTLILFRRSASGLMSLAGSRPRYSPPFKMHRSLPKSSLSLRLLIRRTQNRSRQNH